MDELDERIAEAEAMLEYLQETADEIRELISAYSAEKIDDEIVESYANTMDMSPGDKICYIDKRVYGEWN